jgi:membrane-bound ClpP family serine protease
MILVIACSLLGLILLFFEFFLPGGLMGIIGGLLMVASLFLLIVFEKPSSLLLTTYICTLLFLIFLTIKLALKTVKRKSEKNNFYLDKSQEGYVASIHQKELFGKTAVAASDLKPSGHIFIDGGYYQAVSKSGYIKKDEKVEIEGGEGARLIVKKLNKR